VTAILARPDMTDFVVAHVIGSARCGVASRTLALRSLHQAEFTSGCWNQNALVFVSFATNGTGSVRQFVLKATRLGSRVAFVRHKTAAPS
jgi:hypothetical protein